jgi:hypothetical protein
VTPGRDDDPRDPGERPKRSWREIDAGRDRASSRAPRERRPTDPAAAARAKLATQQYLRQLEGSVFGKPQRGREADRLTRAVREAHGPRTRDACEAYRVFPAFLKTRARDAFLMWTHARRRGARRVAAAPRRPAAGGLRTQLRLLSQSPDDAVAEQAEALLARL